MGSMKGNSGTGYCSPNEANRKEMNKKWDILPQGIAGNARFHISWTERDSNQTNAGWDVVDNDDGHGYGMFLLANN
jgi:hypothetical protein